MSSATTKTPYAEALEKAAALQQQLLSSCVRIEIAGSLRRKKSEIGDLELVCIPHYEPVVDMFGEQVNKISLVDRKLSELGIVPSKNGSKYKQFPWQGMSCDLFITTPEQFGQIFLIRTGSSTFSHWIMTPRRYGGGLPAGMKFEDGYLWENGKIVPTKEEADVFTALGIDWIAPEDRGDGPWKQ